MIEPPALPTEQLKPALPMLPQPGDSFTIVSRGTVWVYGEAPHPLIGKTPNQLHKTWVRRDRDPLYKYLIGGIERFAVPGRGTADPIRNAEPIGVLITAFAPIDDD